MPGPSTASMPSRGRSSCASASTAPISSVGCAEQGARSFAFISAANPGSQPLPEAENEDRHRRLVEQVSAAGLPAIDGESYAAAGGGWRERSLLIAGLAREAAMALAREFGQVALLWGETGGPVELQFADRAEEAERG